MCILLSRLYSCWDMTPRLGVVNPRKLPGHKLDYLAKCANPLTYKCVDPLALPWVQERYDIGCPNCAQTSVHPDAEPTRVEHADDELIEGRPPAKAAAVEYVRVLCHYLNKVLRNDEDTGIDPLFEKLAHCGVELSCKFDPAHVGKDGWNCGCQEANTHPELRNVAAGMRYVPAREQLANPDGPDLAWGGMLRSHHDEFAQACHNELDRFRNLSDIHEHNDMLVDATVLPYWKPTEKQARDKEEMVRWFDELVDHWLQGFGSDDEWCDVYRRENETYPEQFRDACSRFALNQRIRVLYILARLIAADSGLSMGRQRVVLSIFLIGADPNTAKLKQLLPDASLHKPLMDLMEGQLWNIEHDRQRPARYHGNPLADPAQLHHLEAQLGLTQRIRINVEHARARAAQGAIRSELDRHEFEALAPPGTNPGRDKTCALCASPMTYGPAEPPQLLVPRGNSREHRAIRLTCEQGHVVGRSCWMRYWRGHANMATDTVGCLLCQGDPGRLSLESGQKLGHISRDA